MEELRLEQLIEIARGHAKQTRQRNRRKVERFRHADARIGGVQLLFGEAHVGAALQEAGGESHRNLGHQQAVEHPAARHRAGVAAQEEVDRVFEEHDVLLQKRDLRHGEPVLRLGLAEFQFGQIALVLPSLEHIDCVPANSAVCFVISS